MTCFCCFTAITPDTAAEAYSFESGMCRPCYAEFVAWGTTEGIPAEELLSV